MLLNGGALNSRRLLRPETVALLASKHVGPMFAEVFPPLTAGKAFGLSFAVVEDRAHGNGRGAGAFGWGGAYDTETWVDHELEVAAVVLVQRPGPGTVPVAYQEALPTAIQA
jgi:CubicO group peptidase (beta-lactamase class C family)